jgi:G3E family GTPase
MVPIGLSAGHCYNFVTMIPVSIVTGFLGSGKTTLIGSILRDPAFRRTAVIVNEFGEIGLDHDLIAGGDDTVLELTTGCLCCAVQTDLARTLTNLLAHRPDGYDRVLIETSGLADPAPILHALMTDRDLTATHRIAAIVTLIDTVHGEGTLAAHPEARRQVALADHVLLSKTDVAAASAALLAHIATLNPGAPLLTNGALEPAMLFTEGKALRPCPANAAVHTPDIATFVLQRDPPLPALALTLLLQALAEHCGGRMLRMKGLVAIEELPGQPAVIHGVRHVVAEPVFLDRWPSADQTTRIVFIGTGIPPYFPARLLDAIEAEVRSESAAVRPRSPHPAADPAPPPAAHPNS